VHVREKEETFIVGVNFTAAKIVEMLGVTKENVLTKAFTLVDVENVESLIKWNSFGRY
jgi:hypothetical protein